jgi:hypothetical protein
VSRLAAQAQRGARRVKGAAQEMRASPALQHALAARERGNLEAAFWLLGEAFGHSPDAPDVALHYWDVALALGRVDLACEAGVHLVERHASAGEAELAAQHWLELVKGAPDVLVSPAAVAVFLPALRERLAAASEGGPDEPETLAGYVRRALRHAVDPRNGPLHPGVALRLFESGRDINPEACRRVAEAALDFPDLHETKRQRLLDWLGGGTEAPPTASGDEPEPETGADAGLSDEAIEAAASRLPPSRPGPAPAAAPGMNETDVERGAGPPPADAADAVVGSRGDPVRPESCSSGSALRVSVATLVGIDEAGLALEGAAVARLPYADIEAVSVAEVAGADAPGGILIDLISNWSQRGVSPLVVTRLRLDELDLAALVQSTHALGSALTTLMGDIMERSRAVPLPDPESALGMRIARFESLADYEREALRVGG